MPPKPRKKTRNLSMPEARMLERIIRGTHDPSQTPTELVNVVRSTLRLENPPTHLCDPQGNLISFTGAYNRDKHKEAFDLSAHYKPMVKNNKLVFIPHPGRIAFRPIISLDVASPEPFPRKSFKTLKRTSKISGLKKGEKVTYKNPSTQVTKKATVVNSKLVSKHVYNGIGDFRCQVWGNKTHGGVNEDIELITVVFREYIHLQYDDSTSQNVLYNARHVKKVVQPVVPKAPVSAPAPVAPKENVAPHVKQLIEKFLRHRFDEFRNHKTWLVQEINDIVRMMPIIRKRIEEPMKTFESIDTLNSQQLLALKRDTACTHCAKQWQSSYQDMLKDHEYKYGKGRRLDILEADRRAYVQDLDAHSVRKSMDGLLACIHCGTAFKTIHEGLAYRNIRDRQGDLNGVSMNKDGCFSAAFHNKTKIVGDKLPKHLKYAGGRTDQIDKDMLESKATFESFCTRHRFQDQIATSAHKIFCKYRERVHVDLRKRTTVFAACLCLALHDTETSWKKEVDTRMEDSGLSKEHVQHHVEQHKKRKRELKGERGTAGAHTRMGYRRKRTFCNSTNIEDFRKKVKERKNRKKRRVGRKVMKPIAPTKPQAPVTDFKWSIFPANQDYVGKTKANMEIVREEYGARV